MSSTRHTFLAAVHLILEQDGKVLLSRRFNTGYEDGKYSVVAGHIDAGETATTAMVREALEEAGIDIRPEDMQMAHVMHRNGDDRERIDFFIRATKWKGTPCVMENDKCDEMSWYVVDALPENVIPYVRSAIQHIQNGHFYSEFGWDK